MEEGLGLHPNSLTWSNNQIKSPHKQTCELQKFQKHLKKNVSKILKKCCDVMTILEIVHIIIIIIIQSFVGLNVVVLFERLFSHMLIWKVNGCIEFVDIFLHVGEDTISTKAFLGGLKNVDDSFTYMCSF